MMKLSFDRSKIVEDVGMIKLEIVENRGLGVIMEELGALVEKRCVVLVRLNHEIR